MEIDSAADSIAHAEKRAAQEEREVQKRISRAHELAEEAERDSRKRIDDIRDEYVKQEDMEQARHEVRLENEKQKAYQAMREAQRSLSSEARRVNSVTDDELKHAQTRQRDSVSAVERATQEQMNDIQNRNSARLELQRKAADQVFEQEGQEYARRYSDINTTHEHTIGEMHQNSQAQMDQIRTNYLNTLKDTEKKLGDQITTKQGEYQAQIRALDAGAAQTVANIKNDYTRKIDAYNRRNEDPFYHLVDVGAQMESRQDAYVLTATIPQHEREHVGVTVNGNQITLSGSRRNEEHIEDAPGSKRTTSSYQNYTQTFAIDWPIDTKNMRREYVGDQLIVTLPKKGVYERPEPKPKPERVRAGRPQFPGNLPTGTADDTQQAAATRRKDRSGNTLT